jgi:hypothetical protein
VIGLTPQAHCALRGRTRSPIGQTTVSKT